MEQKYQKELNVEPMSMMIRVLRRTRTSFDCDKIKCCRFVILLTSGQSGA